MVDPVTPSQMTGGRSPALWVLSGLLAAAFVGSGVMKFVSPSMAERFAGWGFNDWFRMLVGVTEITCGILLLAPRAATYAAGGLAVVMIGATMTHLTHGEATQALVPAVLLGLLAFVGYGRLPARRTWRWWTPAGILVVAAALTAWGQMDPDLDHSLRFLYVVLLSAGVFLLLSVWTLALSGFRWRTRVAWVAAGIVFFLGLALSVRSDGSAGGDGVPRLVWRWATKRAEPPAEALAPAGGRADLTATTPGDFPRFLGPRGDGAAAAEHLARSWADRPPREVWRQPVGLGWSSFAVVGHYAVTQEQRGDQELVVCYDVPTGRVVWAHADQARFSEAQGGDGPRATPTVVGGRVYALGATGILNCLDGATGKPVWSRNVLEAYQAKNPVWGKSASPLVYNDLVVVTGGDTGPTLLAFRKDSGEPAWNAGEDKPSYASPMLANLAGRRQVIIVNAQSATGHDPKDGHVLWNYPWPGGFAKASQPVVVGEDRLFLSAGYHVGCVLLEFRAAADGSLTTREVWKNKNLKTEFTTAVLHDGFVYGLDDTVLACVDLGDGKRRWKDGRYGYGQVLLAGDLLLVQAESGDVALVEASPAAFHEVARIPALKAKTWNVPALAGKYLLVRNDQEAVCFELP